MTSQRFIFISYPHRNSADVLPLIDEIGQRGFNAWYDIVIEAGTEWPDYIASRLDSCSAVLAFISSATQQSPNCRRELTYARLLGKPVVAVYLEQPNMTSETAAQLQDAIKLYKSNYKDAWELVDAICNCDILHTCSGNSAYVGKIYFGKMQQDIGSVGPICWRVLKREGKTALAISNFGLAARELNWRDGSDVNWENCDLRKWLNNNFYNSVFTPEEQSRILSSRVSVDGGQDVFDKLFILSEAEAKSYFANDASRVAKPTQCASAQGAFHDDSGCEWWLRTPDGNKGRFKFVNEQGEINAKALFTVSYYGSDNDADDGTSTSAATGFICVRPALRLALTLPF